ncbi:MAG: hypothetical protein ACOYKJ_08960 [Candidatus Howiella sp.]
MDARAGLMDMWMTQQLLPEGRENGLYGVIETDAAGRLFLNDGRPLPLSGVLTPYGYLALPAVGSAGRAAPDGEDGYLLAGVIAAAEDLEPGEIRISSAGGAYILLKNSGEVIINGMKIGADGQIVSE